MGEQRQSCGACSGTGRHLSYYQGVMGTTPCPSCGGRGYSVRYVPDRPKPTRGGTKGGGGKGGRNGTGSDEPPIKQKPTELADMLATLSGLATFGGIFYLWFTNAEFHEQPVIAVLVFATIASLIVGWVLSGPLRKATELVGRVLVTGIILAFLGFLVWVFMAANAPEDASSGGAEAIEAGTADE